MGFPKPERGTSGRLTSRTDFSSQVQVAAAQESVCRFGRRGRGTVSRWTRSDEDAEKEADMIGSLVGVS